MDGREFALGRFTGSAPKIARARPLYQTEALQERLNRGVEMSIIERWALNIIPPFSNGFRADVA